MMQLKLLRNLVLEQLILKMRSSIRGGMEDTLNARKLPEVTPFPTTLSPTAAPSTTSNPNTQLNATKNLSRSGLLTSIAAATDAVALAMVL